MRDALRRRLQEISRSHSARETGVTGVTAPPLPTRDPLLHRPLHRDWSEKGVREQCCNTVTPVTPPKLEGQEVRYTSGGDTAGVTDCAPVGLQAERTPGIDPEDWFAHFDERAGIMEFDGGLDRVEAERRALAETIAALGPRPVLH